MHDITDVHVVQVCNIFVILFDVVFSVDSNNRCVVLRRGGMIGRGKGVECCVPAQNTAVQ